MPVKKIFAFSVLLLISCSKPEEITTEEPTGSKEIQCYLLKYGMVSALDKDKNVVYPVEFEYQGNRIVKRLLYGIFIDQRYLSGTEEIHYNQQALPVKITGPDNSSEEVVQEIFYDSENRMIRKEKTIILSPSRSKVIYDTRYTYDSVNRINSYIQTVTNHFTGEIRVFNYLVSYDQNGNLAEIKREITLNEYHSLQITTYTNYDSQKNALSTINVPFDEYLLIRYSKNNYGKVTTIYYDNGKLSDTRSQFVYNYDRYNEHGYPMIGEYRCE